MIAFGTRSRESWFTKGSSPQSKGSELEKDPRAAAARGVCRSGWTGMGALNAPLERLARHGWSVVDGPEATLTPERYRELSSPARAGSFPTAKHVYVATRERLVQLPLGLLSGGWTAGRSCRTPGFSSVISAADSLLPFHTLDETEEELYRVETDY